MHLSNWKYTSLIAEGMGQYNTLEWELHYIIQKKGKEGAENTLLPKLIVMRQVTTTTQ